MEPIWRPVPGPRPRRPAPVSGQTRDYIAASKAPGTIRAYRGDLRHFEAWVASRIHQGLPATPETVADYISDLAEAGMKPATITRSHRREPE